MTGRLQGKTVFVIGGSSGFGLAIAEQAAAAGASLIIAGRDAAKAETVATALQANGASAKAYGVDATDIVALQSLFETVGQVDHLVSMVGGAMGGGFLTADPAVIRATIEGKFFANMMIARTAVPFLRDGGSITLTAGAGGRPDNASGAIIGNEALAGLVRGLGVELAPKLRANAVAPTWTPTPLWRDLAPTDVAATEARFHDLIPLGRVAEPAEVAEAYLFLMSCGFITGQTLAVDGGLTLVA